MPPKRLQRRRTRGWRAPKGTKIVSRPTKWGNPFRGPDAVERFRAALHAGELEITVDDVHSELASARWLACWCAPGAPCHVDVYLEVLSDERGP